MLVKAGVRNVCTVGILESFSIPIGHFFEFSVFKPTEGTNETTGTNISKTLLRVYVFTQCMSSFNF